MIAIDSKPPPKIRSNSSEPVLIRNIAFFSFKNKLNRIQSCTSRIVYTVQTIRYSLKFIKNDILKNSLRCSAYSKPVTNSCPSVSLMYTFAVLMKGTDNGSTDHRSILYGQDLDWPSTFNCIDTSPFDTFDISYIYPMLGKRIQCCNLGISLITRYAWENVHKGSTDDPVPLKTTYL